MSVWFTTQTCMHQLKKTVHQGMHIIVETTKNDRRFQKYRMLEMTNTEHAWTLFQEILNHDMEENIPKSRTKMRGPHINRESMRKMRKKYYL